MTAIAGLLLVMLFAVLVLLVFALSKLNESYELLEQIQARLGGPKTYKRD